MALPNIHEFQAQEVVDYRQVNNNFSELNSNMLHCITATVISYNSSTYVTVVRINSNTTKSLINRTGNVLSADDSVYVYYWTDIDTDGYVGIKLGTPVIEGGGESVGRYLNGSNNSVLVNDLNNTTRVEIEDDNQYNNIMVANSKIFYSKTLHSGSTYGFNFNNSAIIGANNNLYDVLMMNSAIIGNNTTLNSYDSYDSSTDTYTFKALHTINNSLFFGNNNQVQDNRTIYADIFPSFSGTNIVGYNNIFKFYDNASIGSNNQGYSNLSLFGNSNTLQNNKIDIGVSLIGTSNRIDNCWFQYNSSSIIGNENSVQTYIDSNVSLNAYISYLSLVGQRNFIYMVPEGNSVDKVQIFGYSNELNTYSSGRIESCSIFGQENRIGYYERYLNINTALILGSSIYVNGSGLSNSPANSSRLVTIGHNIYYNPYSVDGNTPTICNNFIGSNLYLSNNGASSGYITRSNFIGNGLEAGNMNKDVVTSSTVIGENIVVGSQYNTYSATDNAISKLLYSVIMGRNNNYGNYTQANTTVTASGLMMIGNTNNVNKDVLNSNILGSNNQIADVNEVTVCGYGNNINSSRTATNATPAINIFGGNNVVDPTTHDGSYARASTLIGQCNTLRTNGLLNYTQCPAGEHFILGNYGAVDYTVNSNANQLKIVMSVETLYDSSTPFSNGNAVTIDYQGNMNVVGTITSAGSDFAEYWEWEDSNLANEDRRGLFVTLSNNGLIRIANSGDRILGIVSSKPTVAGGSDFWEWHGKYLKDVFGDYIYEDIEEPIYEEREEMTKAPYTDEQGNFHEAEYETVQVQTGTKIVTRRKLNPDYDSEQIYTNRSERSEYATIAHIGKVVMVDDGTANTGNYLTSTENGIATISNSYTKFVCIKRLDETHIYVLIDNYQ